MTIEILVHLVVALVLLLLMRQNNIKQRAIVELKARLKKFDREDRQQAERKRQRKQLEVERILGEVLTEVDYLWMPFSKEGTVPESEELFGSFIPNSRQGDIPDDEARYRNSIPTSEEGSTIRQAIGRAVYCSY